MTTGQRETLFRQWLDDYQAILLKVARARAEDSADQDDLIQEMLLQLWLSTVSYRGDCKPSTWIYRVAPNTSFGWRRRESRRHGRHRRLVDAGTVPNRPDGGPEQVDVDRLYEVVRTLPVVDSSLVLLYLDGLSYREMSEILGISESNVGAKLNRVKKKLFQLLGGVDHES